MSDDGTNDENFHLGERWLSEPASTSEGELGAFLRNSIPQPDDNYWQSVDSRLSADAPGSELTGFLRGSIPDPTVGYWESIDSRLAEVERDRRHTDELDTDDGVVRPMAMNAQTNPLDTPTKSPKILLAAAAFVLLAGLGAFALTQRGTSNDSVDLATQPEVTATGESAAPAAAQSAGDDDAGVITPTPLSTMQTRLAGNESDTDTLFCFAADDTLIVPIEEPSPGLAVVQLSVQPNGSYSFLALQNENYLLFAAGEGSSTGVFETVPLGILGLSPQLPPYQVTLTEDSISFGEESTLPRVSCADVDSQIQIMRTEIERMQGESSATIPAVDPLSAMRLLSLSPGVRAPSEPYCFAAPGMQLVPAENIAADSASVELTIDSNGFVTLVGLQNLGSAISGTGAGHPEGQFTLGITGYGDTTPQQPDAQVTLTEQSILIGDAVLSLVPCNEIGGQIRIARLLVGLAPIGEETEVPAELDLAPISGDEVLSSGGLGPVRIGMLVSELETDLGVDLDIDTIEGNTTSAGDCGWIRSNLSGDLFIIVETTGDGDAIIRRISTRSADWATPSGIRVGMAEQDLIDTFPGQLAAQQHVYVDNGQYLTFIPNDATDPNTVQFVTEFGIVAEIRAGADRWVGLAESCA